MVEIDGIVVKHLPRTTGLMQYNTPRSIGCRVEGPVDLFPVRTNPLIREAGLPFLPPRDIIDVGLGLEITSRRRKGGEEGLLHTRGPP